MRPYYILAVLEHDKWVIGFGDYTRRVVADEKRDCFAGERTKIIKTFDDQSIIDKQINCLNQVD